MKRLALVGGSPTAGRYVQFAGCLRHATVTAVINQDAQRGRQQAAALGVSCCASSVDELFTRHPDAADVVLVASDTDRRAADGVAAAKHGKHVVVETPLAETAGPARELILTDARNRIRLRTISWPQWDPAAQAVKRRVAAGQLGAVGLVRIHHWRTERDGQIASHGQLIDQLGLACWLVGSPPDSVYAVARGVVSPTHPDYVQVHLGFPGNAMGLIDSWSGLPDGQNYDSLSVIGSQGAAYADDHRNTQLLFAGGPASAPRTNGGSTETAALLDEVILSLDEVSRKLGLDKWFASGVTNAYQAVQLGDAVRRSLDTGKVLRREHNQFVVADRSTD